MQKHQQNKRIFKVERNRRSAQAELLENLQKLKHFKTLKQSNIENEDDQIEYLQQMIENQVKKIQMDLLTLENQATDTKNELLDTVINLLFQMLKGDQAIIRKKYYHREIRNKKSNQKVMISCVCCHEVAEKRKIIRIKQDLGLTFGVTNFDNGGQRQSGKLSITQEMADDGFLQKFNLHISNLDFHIKELMIAMQRQIYCKTQSYLRKSEHYNQTNYQFTEQKQAISQNERNIKQIEEQKLKITQNLIHKLRNPLFDGFFKAFARIEEKRQKNRKQNIQQTSSQTIYSNEAEKVSKLEQKIEDLKKEIKAYQKSINNLQIENVRIKESENFYRASVESFSDEKIKLQEKIKEIQMNQSSSQSKYRFQVANKGREIARLQKIVYQFKQNDTQKKFLRQNQKYSTQTLKDNLPNPNPAEKQNFISRPSVDSRLLELSKDEGFSRFYKKNRGYLKNIIQSSRNDNFTQIISSQNESSSHQSSKSMGTNKTESVAEGDQIKIRERLEIVSCLSLKLDVKLDREIQFKPKSQKRRQSINLIKKIKDLNRKSKDLQKQQGQTLDKTQEPSQALLIRTVKDEERQKKVKSRFKTENQEKEKKLLHNTSGGRNWRQNIYFTERSQKCIDLPEINSQSLTLFGGDKSAIQYERNIGVWPHLASTDKLAIDFENSNFVIQIERYFKYLEQTDPQKYLQYLRFLTNPLTYLQKKKKKLQKSSSTIDSYPSSNLRQTFVKLIRFHQFTHKSCNHVQEFLRMIKFYQF